MKAGAKAAKTVFICRECGHQSPKWMGKCPDCGKWDTLLEEKRVPRKGASEMQRWSTKAAEPVEPEEKADAAPEPEETVEATADSGGEAVVEDNAAAKDAIDATAQDAQPVEEDPAAAEKKDKDA